MAALAADGQEHFRRGVHVLKAQFGVEQDGGGGQVVEKQAMQCVTDGHSGPLLEQGARMNKALMRGKCKNQTKAPKRSA
jgi:hypothetical protein